MILLFYLVLVIEFRGELAVASKDRRCSIQDAKIHGLRCINRARKTSKTSVGI